MHVALDVQHMKLEVCLPNLSHQSYGTERMVRAQRDDVVLRADAELVERGVEMHQWPAQAVEEPSHRTRRELTMIGRCWLRKKSRESFLVTGSSVHDITETCNLR